MSIKRIIAIAALLLQALTFAMAKFADVIPPKIAVWIMAAIGILQAVLPRVQGSAAPDAK